MKKVLLTAVTAAIVGIALPVAAQNVAIVNGKPVPKERVDMLAAQLAKAGRPVGPEMQGQLKDEVIAREIFLQEAQKRGLDATDDYKAQMELARQTILIRELFADYQKKNPVTDADVKAENEDQAKKIIAELKKGAKFEDIAKKQSKDPGSGANGGDLDWATASSYVPEFAQAMTKLKKGEMTQVPVKSQFGWHIIRVDDIRDAKLPKLEDVKPQITQQLQQQKLAQFQESLRKSAKVE
jgi:peptidyl-prolyl cis-trans isomerase C